MQWHDRAAELVLDEAAQVLVAPLAQRLVDQRRQVALVLDHGARTAEALVEEHVGAVDGDEEGVPAGLVAAEGDQRRAVGGLEAVVGRVGQPDDRPALDGVQRALGGEGPLVDAGEGSQQRALDVLAEAAALAPEQRGHDRLEAGEAGGVLREVVAEAQRRVVGPPEVAVRADGGLDVDLTRGRGGQRALAAVPADRAVDDARMAGAHGVVAEPQPRHHAGAVALDEHVGAVEQAPQDLGAGVALEVDGDAALVALELEEERALLLVAGSLERPDRA